MMRKQLLMMFVVTTLMLGSLGNTAKAQEDPLRRFYREGAAAATEAQWQLWNSFSPRQQFLSKIVSTVSYQIWQEYQQPIPMNSEVLSIIMEGVGAQPHEASFIWSRMQANHNAVVGMAQADLTISRTQRFLDCLQRQGTGCIP